MLEDPWAKLSSGRHKFSANPNVLKHSPLIDFD